jgi:hypothetical protein
MLLVLILNGNRVSKEIQHTLLAHRETVVYTSTTKPYDPRELKESVTESEVDVAVMPGTSQRYYEDSMQDFASSGHAGVSKTGPGERTSSCSQVHCIHTGEHQYVYVAMWHPNQIKSAISLGITCSDDSRVWKDLMTQKKPCRGISIRLAQGWGNYPVPTVHSEYI